MRTLGSLIAVATLSTLSAAQDSSSPDFELPEGLEATLWAESPHFYNPTAIDIDSRGRVWVTEAVNYRKWDGRNPGRVHENGDRVVILEDRNGDGQCDSSIVFAQDKDLVAPLGIAVIGERVFVSASPNLFVYTDTDGDDRADKREVFLTGFGGHDHDHGLHSVVAGPDGSLYFNTGNAGPHIVTDRNGWTLRSGSYYRSGGQFAADNKPGLISDDGEVWTGGLILRVGAGATGLAVLAHNFRNNYEVALDSYGNLFQSDNDDDGNQSCRTLWCMEGGNHGYFSADGSRSWQFDRRNNQETQRAHWHADDPGVVPAGTINGAGGPTGVAVYEGTLLRDWIDGAVLNADAGAGVVYAHFPEPDGAGFTLRKTDFMRPSRDREDQQARWFRPSDVAVGTDGAVFVTDWHDPGVGGHRAGDQNAYGGLWRIAPAGNKPSAPAIDLGTMAGRVAALNSPAVNVRELGRSFFAEPDPTRINALRALYAGHVDPRVRSRVMWILVVEHGDTHLGRQALREANPLLRVAAIRALAGAHEGRLPLELIREEKLISDESAFVRREVLSQLRDVPYVECLDILLELCAQYDGADRWYLETIGLVAHGQEDELYSALHDNFGLEPADWDARFEGLAWRLHPESALPAFHARAMDGALSLDSRRRSLDAIAFMHSREAAETMLTLSQGGPKDLRGHADYWVRHRSTNSWREFGLLEQLGTAGKPDLGAAELVFESEVVRTGAIVIDVPLDGAQKIWLVATAADDGNGCDWVDWIAPMLVGVGGEYSLAKQGWLSASAEWGEVRVGHNAAGGPLKIEGHQAGAESIGAHAYSQISFAVPPGYERFVCRAGVDEGGSGQRDPSSSSVRFQIHLEPAEQPGGTAELVALVSDAKASMVEREGAAIQLANDPKGALHLIRQASTGVLDEQLTPAIADAIFDNPDLSVRALASEHFTRPGENTATFPPIAELVALDGDARRGQAVFFSEGAQCSSCHTLERGGSARGGEIGPDLTLIREKYGRPELFDAILNPSAGIAFGYDTWLFETTDGILHSGFLLADGADVVLKDTQGVRQVIPADEVENRFKQKLSTMPQGVALGLSTQELVDLVAFLSSEPMPAPVFGEEIELFNGRDLEGWTYYLNATDADPANTWSVEDEVLTCSGQPIGYLYTEAEYESFHLSLEWRFHPELGAGNAGVLLRKMGPDKLWPRSIEAQLQTRNAGDIWNIDEYDMDTDRARTHGRHTARLAPSSEHELGEWNRYDILLNRGRLELRVNGVLQNVANWCEVRSGPICLQSEGAAISFRNIRLKPIH